MNINSHYTISHINNINKQGKNSSITSFKHCDADSFHYKRKNVPEDYAAVFERVKNLQGKDFVRASYDGILEILNLKSVADKRINFPFLNWLVPADARAAASPANGSMTIYKGLMREKDKWEQFSNIAHEAYHIKQYTDILRLEDVDIDAYIDVVTDLTYPIARDEQKAELREGIKFNVLSFQKKAKTLGIIKKDSEEGKHANILFDALKNYPRLNRNATISDYRNNELEKEAYKFQDKIYNWAKDFED